MKTLVLVEQNNDKLEKFNKITDIIFVVRFKALFE